MSTLKVNKIEPVSGSSVEIVGGIAVGGATTGSNDFVGNQTVTGSIDITGEFLVNGTPISGSGGGSVDTSSLATTGSNTFTGNQIVSGSIVATGDITAPNLTGSAAIDTSSFATTGSNTFEGDQIVNGNFVISTIDTLPAGAPGQIAFQGGNMHVYISGQWNQVQFVSAPAPQTEYTLTGPEMDSGSACSSETTNTFYTDGSSPDPSVFLFQDSELVTPANDGFYASLEASQWFEVSGSGEITATGACESPPPSSFEYDFGYDASNSGSACSATTSNVYSDVDTLAVGEFLWDGPGLANKVDNGYYAGAGTWYEVTGGDGEITATGACD
jgi:hypothetical protein